MQLNGQTAIVTGSSRGIGKAIAQELAREGANVVLNYFQCGEEVATKALSDLSELPGNTGCVDMVQADVSQPDQVAAMVEQVRKRFGRIDILVNNAGITRDKSLKCMRMEQWDQVMQTNLYGVFNCTSAVLPYMLNQKYGRIVNIASVIGQSGNFGQANYAAAKAGVIGFTKSSALECASKNVTVNAVCPGFTDTDMFAAVPADIQDQIKARIPMARFAQPKEVACVVRFLVTEGDYITGQCININGGLYM